MGASDDGDIDRTIDLEVRALNGSNLEELRAIWRSKWGAPPELREEAASIALTVADNGLSARRPENASVTAADISSNILTELADRAGGAIPRRWRPTGSTVTLRIPVDHAIQ